MSTDEFPVRPLRMRFAALLFGVLSLLSSGLGSVFVLFPVLPLLFVNRKLYRWLCDHIIAIWQSFPVALLHILLGIDIHVFGDEIDPEENSLIIMNHRTRLDWLFLWSALFPNSLPRHKIIMKKDMKFLPGSGWAMQCAGFMFIDRKWESDQELFRTAVEYVRHDDRKVNMLLFPEGTDLNPKSRGKSDAYALTNGKPVLKHILYPRVTGFTALHEMMQTNNILDAIYDITVAYPQSVIQSEKDLVVHGAPEAIYFLVQRHAISEIPRDKKGLEEWLNICWHRKERQLESFYATKSFPPDIKGRLVNAIPFLYLSCFCWCATITFWIWLLCTSWVADIFFLIGSAVYSYITFKHNGIDRLELKLFKQELQREKKLLSNGTNGKHH